MITKTLQNKIDKSLKLINSVEKTALRYQPYGAVVAFSGGKDSIVLEHLVRCSGIKHRVEHNLTTIDPPEVVRFIKQYYPYCIINRPVRTFWQLCEHARLLPTRKIRFCCQFLKERTGAMTVTLTGVRRSESRKRKDRDEIVLLTRRRHPQFTKGTFDQFSRYQETEVNCIKGKDKIVVNPMLEWTEADVWAYIRHYSLPYPELYDRGYTRVGCLFCPMANAKKILRETRDYPKYYQAYLRMIQRIYDSREKIDDNQSWHGLTPEQIFYCFISKKSIQNFREELKQPKIDF